LALSSAAEPKKGELKFRKLSDEQKRVARLEAEGFEEFKRLSRLHPSKSDEEIWALVHAA
jgi:hypothetical protein